MVIGSKLIDHSLEWKSLKKIQEAITNENSKTLSLCLDHGAEVNTIVDKDSKDCK